jgi:hypothetical protein
MYLAPLNYDRYFRRIFSDPDIAKQFLEDFLDVEIQEITLLPDRKQITNQAVPVEFDFRCKIEGMYVIIDMQQWYKLDVVKRFYLYHSLNTGLQLENLPQKPIIFRRKDGELALRKEKNYRGLEPVFTLVWMVHDTLNFERNYVSYIMTPEAIVDFLKNEGLWRRKDIQELIKEREELLVLMNNDTKELDFLSKNRLMFAFQKNIVNDEKIQKYYRWFQFAEKTRNKENTKEDFQEFQGDALFEEIIRRLAGVTEEDLEYIVTEEEYWGAVTGLEQHFYQGGVIDGEKKGERKGKKEGEEEGKFQTAKNMLQKGFDWDLILELTGFSKEKFQEFSDKLESLNQGKQS